MAAWLMLCGIFLVLVGVATQSVAAAVILAGVFCMASAWGLALAQERAGVKPEVKVPE